jgi:pteridine reductase
MTKCALITGSGKKRIGFHVAVALARKGYAVALHHHSTPPDEALQTLRPMDVSRGVSRRPDLTKPNSRRMIDAVQTRFGRIDVLVNAAAIWERRPLEKVTAADVRRHFDTNALATFVTCQWRGLIMTLQEEGGCIVNVGDWATVRPYTGYAAYFPSKGGVEVLTRTMAVELGTRNPKVRVNAVLPGPVMLPPDLPEAERQEAINATLVKREGTPEHVAHAVMFLIENDFVTGACVPVDGGRTIYAP